MTASGGAEGGKRGEMTVEEALSMSSVFDFLKNHSYTMSSDFASVLLKQAQAKTKKLEEERYNIQEADFKDSHCQPEASTASFHQSMSNDTAGGARPKVAANKSDSTFKNRVNLDDASKCNISSSEVSDVLKGDISPSSSRVGHDNSSKSQENKKGSCAQDSSLGSKSQRSSRLPVRIGSQGSPGESKTGEKKRSPNTKPLQKRPSSSSINKTVEDTCHKDLSTEVEARSLPSNTFQSSSVQPLPSKSICNDKEFGVEGKPSQKDVNPMMENSFATQPNKQSESLSENSEKSRTTATGFALAHHQSIDQQHLLRNNNSHTSAKAHQSVSHDHRKLGERVLLQEAAKNIQKGERVTVPATPITFMTPPQKLTAKPTSEPNREAGVAAISARLQEKFDARVPDSSGDSAPCLRTDGALRGQAVGGDDGDLGEAQDLSEYPVSRMMTFSQEDPSQYPLSQIKSSSQNPSQQRLPSGQKASPEKEEFQLDSSATVQMRDVQIPTLLTGGSLLDTQFAQQYLRQREQGCGRPAREPGSETRAADALLRTAAAQQPSGRPAVHQPPNAMPRESEDSAMEMYYELDEDFEQSTMMGRAGEQSCIPGSFWGSEPLYQSTPAMAASRMASASMAISQLQERGMYNYFLLIAPIVYPLKTKISPIQSPGLISIMLSLVFLWS